MTQPGTPEELRRLLTEKNAGELTEEDIKRIEYLVALHRHTDPWVRGIARYLDKLKEGQEPLF